MSLSQRNALCQSTTIQNQNNHRNPCLFDDSVVLELVVVEVVVASLQPHHPGVAQLVELDEEAVDVVSEELVVELAVELVTALLVLVAGVSEGVVMTGAGSALGDVIVVVRVIVVGSLQPNHPGVLQVEVVIVLVMVVVGVFDVVVDSSRQPHQPGVLQVSVRVCEVVLVGLLVLLVVVSLLLLSKNFQLKQS